MKYTPKQQTELGDVGAVNRIAVGCPRMLLTFGLLVGISCGPAIGQQVQASSPPQESTQTTPICTYSIVNTFPHDPFAFTQGLVFDNGDLFEGTGLWGESTLRRVDLVTGAVLQILNLSATYFGEGVTLYNNRLIQLTYQSGVGFVYNRNTFALLDNFTYSTEGWGLTHDRQRLIMSDGSSTLRFWNPETFAETGQVQVYDDQGPVIRLNELEYIHGEVLANIWLTDLIARIDLETGQVIAYIDLTGLLGPGPWTPTPDVLNGIAYDSENKRLFVTGKRWPQLFEIELVGCPPLPPVFADGFESGDASGWSSIVGS